MTKIKNIFEELKEKKLEDILEDYAFAWNTLEEILNILKDTRKHGELTPKEFGEIYNQAHSFFHGYYHKYEERED